MRHSIFSSLARTLQSTISFTRHQTQSLIQSSQFSSTAAPMAKKSSGKPRPERRVTMVRYALYHPYRLVPHPLRFSRNRYLRHWTISRAWSVFTARLRQKRELEMERQYNSMRAACEELRTGVGDGGRLFRQAMNKKGIWGGRSDLPVLTDADGKELLGEKGRIITGREAGIPIEYGRGLTDMPPKNGFDESWTR